jgi:hypothetical protein
MAEYIVLLGHAVRSAAVNEIEAVLPIQFPDDRFRFGVRPQSAAGFSVLHVAPHNAPPADHLDAITLVVQETLDAHSRAGAA